jgi:hypothetical protein
MSHVFVSYARADRQRVLGYVKHLRSAGFVVRWDDDLSGQDYDEQLKQWISEAGAAIIFWSMTSITRSAVRSELNYVDVKKVINVRIDPIDPQSVPLKANTRNLIDLSCPDEAGRTEGLLKLVAYCGELAARITPRESPAPAEGKVPPSQQAPQIGSISVGTNPGVIAGTIIGPVRTGR